ncbi:hypothetical protein NPIL_527851 [Nephila pilipes]|uniref:Uncharacterized protein n=1 Tax=Nephila pilipes TaxID=299642 RepID=A0A8X6TX83_NEPPI|nr:hypothetical protein NPIL_527851 [Nephila pilipes]
MWDAIEVPRLSHLLFTLTALRDNGLLQARVLTTISSPAITYTGRDMATTTCCKYYGLGIVFTSIERFRVRHHSDGNCEGKCNLWRLGVFIFQSGHIGNSKGFALITLCLPNKWIEV